MNFLRALTASVLSLVCSIALGLFVIFATLQMTILNRDEVKTWTKDSGVYQTALSDALDSNTAAQEQLQKSSIRSDTLKTALNQTFPPVYVQESIEKVIDSTYNWLDGNAATISFQINTTEKKEAFVNNLSTALEPQIVSMPLCTHLNSFDDAKEPNCLPPGYTPQQLARSLATDAGNKLAVFREPITEKTIAEALPSKQTNNATVVGRAQQAPAAVAAINMWTWLLPIVVILAGGLMVLLSHNKLVAAKRLAGKLTCSLVLTLAVGVAILTLGRSFNPSDYVTASGGALDIVEPILRQALPAIGAQLAWVSGLSALITAATWITLRIIKKRREKALLVMPPESPTPSSGSETIVK